MSLVLVFIKLNERLDALCTNAFTDEEGKWLTEQCPSLLTNEQMVVQFVHTMMCKPVAGSEGMHTRFMVVGSHRDLLHECEETLAEECLEPVSLTIAPSNNFQQTTARFDACVYFSSLMRTVSLGLLATTLSRRTLHQAASGKPLDLTFLVHY